MHFWFMLGLLKRWKMMFHKVAVILQLRLNRYKEGSH